jgi:hypothetical protein
MLRDRIREILTDAERYREVEAMQHKGTVLADHNLDAVAALAYLRTRLELELDWVGYLHG